MQMSCAVVSNWDIRYMLKWPSATCMLLSLSRLERGITIDNYCIPTWYDDYSDGYCVIGEYYKKQQLAMPGAVRHGRRMASAVLLGAHAARV